MAQLRGNIPSLDQISSLMVGLSVVNTLVGDRYVQPTPTDPNINIQVEVKAIVNRLVGHMAYNNWYMLNVNKWPVTNGGGDLILMAYPILEAAYKITGNYTFPTEMKRRLFMGYQKKLQPCLTGYGHDSDGDITPSDQNDKCSELADDDNHAPLFWIPVFTLFELNNFLQKQAHNYMNDHNNDFLAWSNGGDYTFSVEGSSFNKLWNYYIPNQLSQEADLVNVFSHWLDEFSSEMDAPKFVHKILEGFPEIKEYNKTIIYNLGVASGKWNPIQSSIWCNSTGNYANDLINSLLINQPTVIPSSTIRDILNTFPMEGSYRMTAGVYNSPNEWLTNTYHSKDWKLEYKWNGITTGDWDVYEGMFSGIDYLLLHNLYYLSYGNQISPPNFEEDTYCNCSATQISFDHVTSTNNSKLNYKYMGFDNIQPPSIYANDPRIVNQLNNELKFLEPCIPNVFENTGGQITGIFNIKNQFENYKDIKIFNTKVQTADCSVEAGGDINVQTNFVSP